MLVQRFSNIIPNKLQLPILGFQQFCQTRGINNPSVYNQSEKLLIIGAFKAYNQQAMKFNQFLQQQYRTAMCQVMSQEKEKIRKEKLHRMLTIRKQKRPLVPLFEEADGMEFEEFNFEEVKQEEFQKISGSDSSNENCEESTSASEEPQTTTTKTTTTTTKKGNQKLQILIQNVESLFFKMQITEEKFTSKAYELCPVIMNLKAIKNRSNLTLAAAIIIHASRIVGKPLTTRRISQYIDCKERTLNKIFNILKESCEDLKDSRTPSPDLFVPEILRNLQLHDNQQILQGTSYLLRKMESKLQIEGQQAGTVAATAVKIAAHLNGKDFSFKQITDASGVCQISVRNCYNICLANKSCIFNEEQNYIMDPKFLPQPSQNYAYEIY